MKRITGIAAGIFLLVWSITAAAIGPAPRDPGASLPYVGFGYSQLSVDPDVDDVDVSPTALTGRIGVEDQFLGVEGRGSLGLSTDSDNDVRYELDQMLGAYVRGSWPVHRLVRPYVIGGYTRIKSRVTEDLSGERQRSSISDSGVSAGLGLDVQVASDLVLNLEFMHYIDGDDGRVQALGIGIRSGLSPPSR